MNPCISATSAGVGVSPLPMAQTVGGERLLAHVGVGLPVQAAALGMPNDDGVGAGIPEHFGREVACERPRGLGVAVLGADPRGPPLRRSGELGKERRRRAHHDIDPWKAAGALDDPVELGCRGAHPIHLPVARHQRTPRPAHHVPISRVFRVRPSG